MLPGKRDFYHCCKARRIATHTRKQRVLAAISKLRSAYFTGYKNKICTYYIYILEKWFPFQGERAHSLLFFCIERRKMRGRQNNNRPINLPKVKLSSQITSTPPHPTFIIHKYQSLHTYIHTYIYIMTCSNNNAFYYYNRINVRF